MNDRTHIVGCKLHILASSQRETFKLKFRHELPTTSSDNAPSSVGHGVSTSLRS